MYRCSGEYYEERIGPAHPLYIHERSECTQVAIFRKTEGRPELICQFTGFMAKLMAASYLRYLNGKTENDYWG